MRLATLRRYHDLGQTVRQPAERARAGGKRQRSAPGLTSFIGGTNLSALELDSAAQPGKPNMDYGVSTHAEIDCFVGKEKHP